MILGILSFLFGVLLLQQFSSLPNIHWCWALVSIVVLPFVSYRFRFCRIFIIFVFGFLWALLRAHWVLDVALPDDLQGKDILVTGVIASIPLKDSRKRRFEFDIETLEHNKKLLPSIGKVRISWYSKPSKSK